MQLSIFFAQFLDALLFTYRSFFIISYVYTQLNLLFGALQTLLSLVVYTEVSFLLLTTDSFNANRWDYMFFFRLFGDWFLPWQAAAHTLLFLQVIQTTVSYRCVKLHFYEENPMYWKTISYQIFRMKQYLIGMIVFRWEVIRFGVLQVFWHNPSQMLKDFIL